MKQIRKNILRVAVVLTMLLILLAGYGVYSINTYGNRWFSSSANTFLRNKKKDVTAGDILDRSGAVLAATRDGQRVYPTDERTRRAVVHVVGDSEGNVKNGVESFQSSALYGFNMGFLERLSCFVRGQRRTGDTVRLTIDSRLSAYIASLFPTGKRGAVTVMNYKTGEVLAENSFPNFDPLDLGAAARDGQQPFFNRAVQGLYAPGSTFKIVTTASMLQSFSNAQSTEFQCTGLLQLGDRRVTDAGTRWEEGVITRHGTLTLAKAFQVSCNNTFAQIALSLGDARLRKTAEDFGFNDNFLFRDIVVENSSYPVENRTEAEIAWTGAGQSMLTASPLHMCLVAAAVANDGVIMEPKLYQSITAPNGKTRSEMKSRVYRKAMDAETAGIIKEYMRSVVTAGTGTAANISGVRVCGKTGSAEVDTQQDTNAWFVGFLDEEKSPYALSIVVEDAGGGGSVAAPIARKIFEWLLNNGYGG